LFADKGRLKMYVNIKKQKIKDSKEVYQLLKNIYKIGNEDKHKERFYVLGFNSNNVVLYADLIAIGTVNYCQPIVRECLRQAIIKNAVSIIVSHNHPSGTLQPSDQDLNFTRELKKICKILDINLMDHIIYTENDYYTMAEQGQL